MVYTDLLKQKEWQQKCNIILNRDRFKCKDCGHVGYHNGNESFLVVDSIDDVEDLLGDWRLDGFSISLFLSMAHKYEFDCFTNVELKNDKSFGYDNMFLLRFHLYDEQSIYFDDDCMRNTYGSLITNYDCHKIGMKALELYKKVTNIKFQLENSWIYFFLFDKPLTNKIYVRISGHNYYHDSYIYGDYQVSINYDNKLLVFSLHSKDPIFYILNIHHTYYICGHKPWDYNNDVFTTLCEKCHKKRHMNQKVPIFNEMHDTIDIAHICDKCGGSGYLPEYNHVEHGICFMCGGEGVIIPKSKI